MMKRRSAAISPKKKATLPEAGRKLSPRIAASVGFAAVLFFFWWLSCPHILSFHEQNQLFLFDWKYLAGRLSVSGGLADWCSEFIVQFFCYPALGAFMMALLFSLLQWALSRLFANYALSFVVPLLVLVWMGDVDALVSFPVALAGAALLCPVFEKCGWWGILAFPVAFWLLGPVGAIPMIYALLRRHSVREVASFVAGAALCYALYRLFLRQYPARDVFCGINYYRGKYTLPALQVAAMLSLPVLFLCDSWMRGVVRKPLPQALMTLVFVAAGIVGMRYTYTGDLHTLLKLDYHIRYNRFEKVLETAQKERPRSAPACTAVNLALYMTGRMDKDFGKYPQVGTEGLIMPVVRDNISDIATSEVFWRLGLPNQALEYCFDLQESIPNCRKSGRFTCRIAQCHILDGHYDIASRYLDVLSKTLFYRSWAKAHKKLLWNEQAIDAHPVYSVLKSFRMEEDVCPGKENFDQILACLYHKNPDNVMAALYFQAWNKLRLFEQYTTDE